MFDKAYRIDLKAMVIVDEGEINTLMIFFPDDSSIAFALPVLKSITGQNDGVSLKDELETKLGIKSD